MHIGWPQGILLSVALMSVGMALAKDGEPKGVWSFWWSAFAAAFEIAILYWGGFFG